MKVRKLVLAWFFAALPVALSIFPGSVPAASAKPVVAAHNRRDRGSARGSLVCGTGRDFGGRSFCTLTYLQVFVLCNWCPTSAGLTLSLP